MIDTPFVGQWSLKSAELVDSNGGIKYPFGKGAAGSLMYLDNGYVSWAMMSADRPNFKSPDPLSATPEEKIAAYSSYFSYSGTWAVKLDKVVHDIHISLFPNWTGTTEERHFEFDDGGNRLTLRTDPMTINGATVTGVFKFARAQPANP